MVFFGTAVSLIIYAASQTVAYRPFLRIQNSIDDSHFMRRFLLRGAEEYTTDQIVIVDIDDRSIKALGKFKYWKRQHFGEVISALKCDGARFTFLDIILMDGGSYRDNRALADSIRSAGNVLSGYYFNLDTPSTRQRPLDPVFNERLSTDVLYPEATGGNDFIKAEQIVLPYTELVVSVRGLGFTNYIPDPDGVARHIPLYISYGKIMYPSVSLQLWMHLKGLRYSKVRISPEGIRIGETVIPTDKHCFMRINYTGKQRTFLTVSFIDILNGDFETGTFNGKIVMIGSSSEKLNDIKEIPGYNLFPGVEIHASALATLLSGRFLRVSSGNITLLITLASGILASLVFSFLPPFRAGLPIVIGILLTLYAFAVYSFVAQARLVNISLPSFVILILYAVITIHRIVETFEAKNRKAKIPELIT